MSMDIHVCWRGTFAPTRGALAEALKKVGFEATVLHDFLEEEGYWPIDIEGVKTGVEVYPNEDLADLRDIYPTYAEAAGSRDRGVTFTFHSDPMEGAVAVALAAAITQLCDAVIYEPSEGVVYSPQRAIEEARKDFERAKTEGYTPRDG